MRQTDVTPTTTVLQPSVPQRTLRLCRLLLAVLLCGVCMPTAAVGETVKLGGTGTGLGTMQMLAERLRNADPQFSLGIVPNLGSSGGLKALAAGAIDIAVTSRPLKSEEIAQGLVASEYGKTPFVLVTSKKGVTDLTTSQLVDMYAGKQLTWPDGSPIRLVLRPANDSDTGLLAGFSAGMRRALDSAMAREGMIVATNDQESVDSIGRLPGALGTSSLALLLSEKRPLTPLAINGVVPSVETIADGSYPYLKSMYLVIKSTPSAQVSRFLSFVLSPEGQTILRATGHWSGANASLAP